MGKDGLDIIVVGAGHAGCEAALAAARMGCSTLLLSLCREKIGFLSCNPAIGGIGKGQLVKELDALGGEMAHAADASGIQFKILNASKGPAVWSSRAQVDRKKYALYMQKVICCRKHLELLFTEVIGLIAQDGVIRGIQTKDKGQISAKAVILTPGTFLNGLMHIGMRSFAGGRIEEKGNFDSLSQCLKDLGLGTLRFKTGTCARLDGKTIDFSCLQAHSGDEFPRPFSFSTKKLRLKQVPCYSTYTDERTHEIVRRNLGVSPLFSGKITGAGVRYCPSFEDKVVKFPHHPRHQIFLEPEGLDTDEYYPNGLSTSLPENVQEEFIHSIRGLEQVKINRFGYGIEHDVVDPTQLYPTLETKEIKNLYLAGQINGTTGYEEAAAQGLIAGINAALRVRDQGPFVLDRAASYIGVLIDDLITKGTPEPYRMFTSRVEYRLILREDNADLRLRRWGYELGLVSKKEFERAQEKQNQINAGVQYLKSRKVVIKEDTGDGKNVSARKVALGQILKRPGTKIENLNVDFPFPVSPEALKGIEIEVKYAGFIQRQAAEVRGFQHLEKIKIPADLDYQAINGLSLEIREKLTRARPLTLGQASRISGVTPVAITVLIVYLKT
ncbi:MAG: tRNA uridine-5-carboxymethylaminomethyl(34) synthesis enzyme MnmG [Candidatus Omnitrophota bacterium]